MSRLWEKSTDYTDWKTLLNIYPQITQITQIEYGIFKNFAYFDLCHFEEQ